MKTIWGVIFNEQIPSILLHSIDILVPVILATSLVLNVLVTLLIISDLGCHTGHVQTSRALAIVALLGDDQVCNTNAANNCTALLSGQTFRIKQRQKLSSEMINKVISSNLLCGWRKCQGGQLRSWLATVKFDLSSCLAHIFIVYIDGITDDWALRELMLPTIKHGALLIKVSSIQCAKPDQCCHTHTHFDNQNLLLDILVSTI